MGQPSRLPPAHPVPTPVTLTISHTDPASWARAARELARVMSHARQPLTPSARSGLSEVVRALQRVGDFCDTLVREPKP